MTDQSLLTRLKQAGLPVTDVVLGDPVLQGDNYSTAPRSITEYTTGEKTEITPCTVTWTSGPTAAQRRLFREIAGASRILSDEVTAPLGSLWTPAQLTTAYWFDASDTDTITESSGLVSQWDDKSANARHLQQTDNAIKPTTNSSTQNGKNVLEFGTTAGMNNTDSEALPDQNYSLYVVYSLSSAPKPNTRSTTGYAGGAVDAKTSGYNAYIGTWNSNYAVYTGGYSDTLEAVVVGNYVIGGIVGNGAAGSGLYYHNGETGIATTGSTKWGYAALGVSGEYAAGEVYGNIAEVVAVASNLNDTDRQKLEGYLAHKWGIEGNLPADHPYKTEAP